jgi:hypothetical protein
LEDIDWKLVVVLACGDLVSGPRDTVGDIRIEAP